jgi:hypothetical protein
MSLAESTTTAAEESWAADGCQVAVPVKEDHDVLVEIKG